MSNERDKAILELLLKEKQVTVKQLASHLYISEPSVRRDLAGLERQHLIKRIHGGAMIEKDALSKSKIPFTIRELEQSDAKIIIAKKAMELIHDNDVIFLDASTSAYNIIQFLPSKKNITVVTNGTGDKFGKQYYHNLCHMDEIDGFLTDIPTESQIITHKNN